MAVHERARQPIESGGLIEFGPPVVDRAALESVPGAGTVEFYLLTEAASRAWAAVSARLASAVGAIFWIGGPSGAGKTHFLNYVMALEERAGTSKGRRAIVRLGLEAGAGAYDLEQRMFDLLAREIGVGDAGAMLWRRLHGGEALGVAFEQAHRVGIRAISVAIDFGAADASAWDEYFAELARVAARDRQVAFNVYVAARSRAPASAIALEIAPVDGAERMLAALARTRRVVDDAGAAALYDGAHVDGSGGGFEPRAIFPFDPRSIETLRALAGEPSSVATMAKLVSAALAAWRENTVDGRVRPLLPAELMDAAAVARRVDERLGEGGRAALRIAYRAADAMEERGGARGIVDVLLLEWLSGGALALSPGELRTRMREHYQPHGSFAAAGAAIATMLDALAARTGGVIAFDARGAQFNPRAAGAPEVAAFNNALPLLQRFDSTLNEAAELPELRTGLKRAGDAMARAVEAAHRVGTILDAAHRELRTELKPEHRQTLDDFIALAGAGAGALVEQAAEAQSRAHVERVVVAYDGLATAAVAAPRLREMREYLRATELMPDLAGDSAGGSVGDAPAVDKAVAAAQVECQLLLAALETAMPRWDSRSVETLQIRFQKFKWNYIQIYQGAHERWRRESDRIAMELADAREHFGALARLNSIAALGAPVGAALEIQIEELGGQVVRCTADAPITLDLVPRCPRCGLILGMAPPASELGEVFEQMRRALKTKLAALSHDAIARLIRQHDRSHRLDGFLKITQAAHTDALVRVLDDNLARYLGRLLDEVPDGVRDATRAETAAQGAIDPFVRARRDVLRSGKPAGRTIKPRSD
jgi:hypothetical protein